MKIFSDASEFLSIFLHMFLSTPGTKLYSIIAVIVRGLSECHAGSAAWAGSAMAHPKFWLGGPQCIWPHQ